MLKLLVLFFSVLKRVDEMVAGCLQVRQWRPDDTSQDKNSCTVAMTVSSSGGLLCILWPCGCVLHGHCAAWR
jgi:hypothetical protein